VAIQGFGAVGRAAAARFVEIGVVGHAGFSRRPEDLLAVEVVEGANLPTSAEAREILHARGVLVVPDFIANAGGIVAAAHSTDARNSPFTVNEPVVFAMISEKLRSNNRHVLVDGRRRQITPHRAALDLAQSRVLAAMTARGFRPDEALRDQRSAA
jgi:glutamate dehydrogenase/leucine dehydrogenase